MKHPYRLNNRVDIAVLEAETRDGLVWERDKCATRDNVRRMSRVLRQILTKYLESSGGANGTQFLRSYGIEWRFRRRTEILNRIVNRHLGLRKGREG